jgi:hypothetical protein
MNGNNVFHNPLRHLQKKRRNQMRIKMLPVTPSLAPYRAAGDRKTFLKYLRNFYLKKNILFKKGSPI